MIMIDGMQLMVITKVVATCPQNFSREDAKRISAEPYQEYVEAFT